MGRWVALLVCASAVCLWHCGAADISAEPDPDPLPDRTAATGDAGPPPAPTTTTPDGGDPIHAPVDAGPACDLTKPFGAPVLVAGFDPSEHAATPRLAHDELTIYFTGKDGSGNAAIMQATRASKTAAWGAPSIVSGPANAGDGDHDPSVPHDGLTLWFSSTRDDGDGDLYMATRATVSDPFGAATRLATVNSGDGESHAYFRNQGNELWFVSNRGGNYDIYLSTMAGGAFSAPTKVTSLSSSDDDYQPQPSDDGLRVLFASKRSGGQGDADLYFATRTTTAADFGAPAALTTLNSSHQEQAGFISDDGCRIWFSSDRDYPGDHNVLYQSSR